MENISVLDEAILKDSFNKLNECIHTLDNISSQILDMQVNIILAVDRLEDFFTAMKKNEDLNGV